MSQKQRWHKIIADTDKVTLSDQQIFWRSVAQLRLGDAQNALKTFESLGPQQFKNSTFKLHLAELYLKNNLFAEGEALLIELYQKVCDHPEGLKQWIFIAKRYPNPQKSLELLLGRNPVSTSFRPPNFKDRESWCRAQRLDQYGNDPNYYLAWLDWTLTQPFNQAELIGILKLALSTCPKNGFMCYHFFERLKSQPLWQDLIELLFQKQHRIQTQPELMWKHWWQHCPSEFKSSLKLKMSSILEKQPNQKLEELLAHLN